MREDFDQLEAAIAALERRAKDLRSEGPIPAQKLVREFKPEELVAARLEISTGGLLRGRTAGVDVMGDGRFIAFRGGMRREELDPGDGYPWTAVRDALA